MIVTLSDDHERDKVEKEANFELSAFILNMFFPYLMIQVSEFVFFLHFKLFNAALVAVFVEWKGLLLFIYLINNL